MWARAYGLIQYFVWIATANYSIITWTKLVRLGLLGCVHCSIQAYWWSTATTAFPVISLLISSLKCDVVVTEWQSLLYVCRLMNSNFGLQIYSFWTKQTNLINQYLSCVNRHLTMLCIYLLYKHFGWNFPCTSLYGRSMNGIKIIVTQNT